MDIKKLLGKKIKEYRNLRGYSQEYLAELLGISQRTLSGIECGENFLTSKTLDKILEILMIQPSELFSVEYLKDNKELVSEIVQDIMSIKDNEEKVQLVYRVVKAILNK